MNAFFQNKTNLIILGIIGVLIVLLIFLTIYTKNAKKKTRVDKIKAQKKKNKYLQQLYVVLSKNRFTKGYVTSLAKRFGIMSIFTKDEIQQGVARYTKRLFIYTIAAITISSFVFEDIMSVLICVAVVFCYYMTSIELNLQKTVVKVYKELKNAVSSISLEYRKSRDVLLALENAEYGDRIAPIMSELEGVLSSVNGDEALTAFYQKVPFKQMQTLAMVCYNINNTGDEIDTNNNSTFDEAMLIINSDINQKIEEYDYEAIKFGKLEYLSLIGIVATIGLKYLIAGLLPSAAVLYNSVIGLLIQYGCLIYSVYSYWKVSHGHIRKIIATDDRLSIVSRLLEIPFVANFIHIMGPRNQKKRQLAVQLERAFSKKSIDDFVCEQWFYAGATFLFLFVTILIAPYIQKNFIQNYTGAFDLAGSISYEDENKNKLYTDKEVLAYVDDEYIVKRQSGKWKDMTDDDVAEIDDFLINALPKLKFTTISLQDQRTRLAAKFDKLMSKQPLEVGKTYRMKVAKRKSDGSLALRKLTTISGETVYVPSYKNMKLTAIYSANTDKDGNPIIALANKDGNIIVDECYGAIYAENSMFHFWYIFLPFAGAFIAYRIPKRSLKKRMEIAKDDEEEEFLQLQIVMMILCSMNFDTLNALGHLAQIADIHKEMLLYCYYGYASDPEGELNRMKKKTQSENFRYFISKLEKTVEDLSIKEAFADLKSDREHICNERATYVRNSIDKKRGWLGQTALRPMQVAIYGMLVFPLVYTGITGLSSAFNSIQSL